MKLPSLEDDKGKQLLDTASYYFDERYFISALDSLEDLSFVKGHDNLAVRYLQGRILSEVARRTEQSDVKFTFLLGSADCFSFAPNPRFLLDATRSFFSLAQEIRSAFYYKRTVGKAKEFLSAIVTVQDDEEVKRDKKELKIIIGIAESRIAESKTCVGSLVKNCEKRVREPQEIDETKKNYSDSVNGLRSYWAGLDVESKRNLMKVSTAELASDVEELYGREGRDALEQVLTSAREDMKWRFWMCRSCSKKFSSPEECKNHLEQEHDALLKLLWKNGRAQTISKGWARKISVGGWEPVDSVDAVEMIKNQFEDVKAFAYENGWSKDWPLAADEERSKLLKEIQSLLVLLCDHKILSCSIRDWVMRFTVKYLEKLQISKLILTECHLLETPQCICFLECHELDQILDFLKKIKCERHDGFDLVCRTVDSFCNRTRVKEKIYFDDQFLFLLLDKRLLQCKIARFDDEGTINVYDPNVLYANVHAHGDDMLSWLEDYTSEDEIFRLPRPIRAYNLDIWVAGLRAIQFICRNIGAKYSKKSGLLHFNSVLGLIENICLREKERRANIPEDQWSTYASLLCDQCEPGDSFNRELCFFVVRDVLKGASYPTFDFRSSEESLNVIRGHRDLSDDKVLKSIELLRSVVTNKVPLIDSKILLIEKTRINLLNDLTRLCVLDYRSYIFPALKEFLVEKLIDMESETNVASTDTELLLEEEKKSQLKKKKRKSNKRTSTSMSSPLDKTVEHEHSVNLETEGPSLETAEGDSMEPRGRLEILPNTDNPEDAAKGMRNMPGEDLLSEHLESAHGEAATRYNSALDMSLKALLNIKVLQEDLVNNQQPFHGSLDAQVPNALQDFFSAFVSEQIKEEGLYSYLLSNLLASLEEVYSLSSDVAEVVVAILESWQCWKSLEIESLVVRLFTLEEYERVNCRKCRRKSKFQEQSSYGIVMAADSIRNLKCAFGNIQFEDIIKVIRMEDRMLCDTKTGGCGKKNFVHHMISRCPPIFTIVLEWEKNETGKEIFETTKALDWEIDISRLYEGLEEPNTTYQLVSMVGWCEDSKHMCIACEKDRWVSLRHDALPEEAVGNWKSVVRFCGERKVRPDVLFYESTRSMSTQVA